jgi:hypothetical protein
MKQAGRLAQPRKLARRILIVQFGHMGHKRQSRVFDRRPISSLKMVTFAADRSGFSEIWPSNGLTCWIEQRVKLLFQGLNQDFRPARFLHGCSYNLQHALRYRETA